MNLDYLVLYCSDPAASTSWYESALALRFQREQHGGPIHFSTKIGGTILELYPAVDRPTTRTRIGLVVSDLYGVRPEPVIVTDPDGNTIEIRFALVPVAKGVGRGNGRLISATALARQMLRLQRR